MIAVIQGSKFKVQSLPYDETRDSQSGGEVRWNRTNLNFGLRNRGSGAIDEFATWNDELSPDEITARFAAITNAATTIPILQITLAPPNVLLSWPSSTPASYALEATLLSLLP